MKTSDEKYGKVILSIGRDKDGAWTGVVILGGKIVGEKLHD
jgi:hypothetical protein